MHLVNGSYSLSTFEEKFGAEVSVFAVSGKRF